MTERKVGVIQITGHRPYAGWDKLLKEYQVYEIMDPPPGTDITLQYNYHINPLLKDKPITVKGNSRQEVVQGKRHSWPVAKKRKGCR